MRRVCGIYMIRNLVDEKVYVGQSYDIALRWQQHKKAARGKRPSYLYNAMRFYGTQTFELRVLEECPEESLDAREAYWMAHFKCHDRKCGYNYRPAGQLRQAVTPEARAAISHRLAGRKLSAEHIEKMRAVRLGVPIPESAKEKLREFHTGIVLPADEAARIRDEVASTFTKPQREPKRLLCTDAYKTEAFRQQCSERFKGKPKSEAAKAKMRAKMLAEPPDVRERRLAALRAVTKARWAKFREEKARAGCSVSV